jgi:putative ABC transport system permease protein
VVVRTSDEPRNLILGVRREMAAFNPNLPPNNIQPLTENIRRRVWLLRTLTIVLVIFGLLGMILAAVGVYGVMSYAVAQRTREIGVRMALGAQAGEVLRLMIWRGMRLALIGVALGLAAALAMTRIMQNMLFKLSAPDPATFALIALLLIGVALIASYIPARRATKVDPLVALRCE